MSFHLREQSLAPIGEDELNAPVPATVCALRLVQLRRGRLCGRLLLLLSPRHPARRARTDRHPARNVRGAAFVARGVLYPRGSKQIRLSDCHLSGALRWSAHTVRQTRFGSPGAGRGLTALASCGVSVRVRACIVCRRTLRQCLVCVPPVACPPTACPIGRMVADGHWTVVVCSPWAISIDPGIPE